MNKRRPNFQVLVGYGGNDLDTYRFERPPIDITYSLAFQEQEARIAAGISGEDWLKMPGTPQWCTLETGYSKSHILIWHRMSLKIPAAQQDAAMQKLKRKR